MSAATKTSIGIVFRYRGVRCRERIKLPPTPRNKAYAANLRGQILTEIAKGSFDYRKYFPDSPRVKLFAAPAALLTIEQLLENWWDKKKAELEASSADGYRKIIFNVLIPSLGRTVLADFSVEHAKQMLAARGEISPKRRNNILGPLRGALDDAVDKGLLPANPLEKLKFKRRAVVKEKDDVDPFDPAELKAIIEVDEHPQFRNMIRFWAASGLRTSEVMALQWADVDLVAKQVTVRRALVEKKVKGPKTVAGIRVIALQPPAIAALVAQKEHTQLAGKEVFQNPLKRQAWEDDQQVRNQFRRRLKLAGVRYRYPYQLRHSFASLALTAGENVMWVSKQMGHKDWTVTARIYARWIQAAAPNAGAKLAKLWV